jgi:GR25 family glycosyltransferase involved in LPS biosynthesis
MWKKHLNNLPDDWDILRICCMRGRTEQDIIEEKYKKQFWSPVSVKMWGTGCYALSRNGMKYMLKSIENFMQPIDCPLFNYKSNPNVKHYLPKIPLGLCLEDSLSSDISPNIDKCKLYYKDITNISLDDYRI